MDSSTTNNLYCLSPQFFSISSSSLSGSDGGDALVPWTKEENKAFETAVAEFEPSDPHWWEKISSRVPGRTVGEVQRLYELLEEEMEAIVSDMVGVPDYVETMESVAPPLPDSVAGTRKKRKRRSKGEPIRKGVQWTEEEHRRFLVGLQKYGKGDWRSIARHCVLTRTPTQVASHAQKYFKHCSSEATERRARRLRLCLAAVGHNHFPPTLPRPSIFDITNPNRPTYNDLNVQAHPGPGPLCVPKVGQPLVVAPPPIGLPVVDGFYRTGFGGFNGNGQLNGSMGPVVNDSGLGAHNPLGGFNGGPLSGPHFY